MSLVLVASIALGILGNTVAVHWMGGRWADALSPGMILAGAAAGATAGWFTIWSRRRRGGDERFVDGMATYYLGLAVSWASFVVIQRILLCVRHGGWTDFDLRDHLMLIFVLLVHGTFWSGIILIPACFAARALLWWIYRRRRMGGAAVSVSDRAN